MHWTDLTTYSDLHPARKHLRTFGLILSTFIIAFFIIRLLKGMTPDWIVLGIGLILILISVKRPHLLKVIYIPWMLIARLIGIGLSSIILMLIYYTLLTPIGLIRRKLGYDPLRLKKRSKTYWLRRDSDRKLDFERMF